MKRDEVLGILSGHQGELRRKYRVKSLALFGSVARDEATKQSDVDLLVEFDGSVGLFHVVETELYIKQLLDVERVDLVVRTAVLDELKEAIYGEAIDVFKLAPVEVPPSAHP